MSHIETGGYFYITTTLPYVNAKPHMGHALEFVQADVLSRLYKKKLGEDAVVFNVGTDEHGLKIFQSAQNNNISVEDFIQQNVYTFQNFFETFMIGYSSFYRTSTTNKTVVGDIKHQDVAQSFWSLSQKNGAIYSKSYTGNYCIGCESFKTSKELIDGKCPDHNTVPVPFDEENYFFRMSDYRKKLTDYIQTHDFIYPASKKQELLNFVANMDDISISRQKSNLPRGIPVPGDDNQVMYVWFDALTNYVGAVGFPNHHDVLDTYRPGIQLCGPDNLRFQGAIWQSMLASVNLPFTKKILVHGMILGPDGNKMSKTLGNVIDPIDQYNKFGLDAVRFYLIAGLPTFGDASYKESDLVFLYNSCLADTFGNLLSRVIHLANKFAINLYEPCVPDDTLDSIIIHTQKIITDIDNAFAEFDLYKAYAGVHKLAMDANKYFNDMQPRSKDCTPQQAIQILRIVTKYYVDPLITLYEPLLPSACEKAYNAMHTQQKIVLFPKIIV